MIADSAAREIEVLEVHVDGVTYRLPRQKLRSGRWGFYLTAGADIHGRRTWLQVIAMDVKELGPIEQARKMAKNRARKKAKKELVKEMAARARRK